MNSKHRRTLEAIFKQPPSAAIKWSDFVALMNAAGAKVIEGDGSRIRFVLNGSVARFHRPHPGNTMDKGAVKDAKTFFEMVGVKP